MYYGKINDCDIANGEGVRVSLFVSGCRNRCKGCFNPETWDFQYGQPYTGKTEDFLIKLLARPYIRGLTLLGGDPFEPENKEVLTGLLQRVKQELPDKDVWCYTGYRFEDVKSEQMMDYIDVLVDGRYEEELHDISLRFHGSSNQRIFRKVTYRITGTGDKTIAMLKVWEDKT